jgi:hypothetical protein
MIATPKASSAAPDANTSASMIARSIPRQARTDFTTGRMRFLDALGHRRCFASTRECRTAHDDQANERYLQHRGIHNAGAEHDWRTGSCTRAGLERVSGGVSTRSRRQSQFRIGRSMASFRAAVRRIRQAHGSRSGTGCRAIEGPSLAPAGRWKTTAPAPPWTTSASRRNPRLGRGRAASRTVQSAVSRND